MANRTIIEIDQGKCNGCGLCETGCPEGALKVIAGKARLVGESLCDGLGACIGRCPQDAIRFIEKDAADYDEIAVLKEILPQGAATLRAHFDHLDSHGFERFGQQKPFVFSKPSGQSSLKNWPIQLHLANPKAANFETADLVIAADCTAFALGSFHADIMTEKSLVIACPKLDSGKDLYVSKLSAMLKQARSVSVILMEVPCCSGLLKLAQEARTLAGSNITLNVLVVGIDGGFVAQSAK
ncbi:MAG: ATP-binding protein [Spirochaetales bacterium]